MLPTFSLPIQIKGMAKRKIGGARRDRTADLLHAMQALSQLSYGPTARARTLLSRPWGVKANQRAIQYKFFV
jgi:hypothetical protein